MTSGIYIRVGKENLLLEELVEDELLKFLKGLDKEGLIRTIFRLCEVLNYNENELGLFDELESGD